MQCPADIAFRTPRLQNKFNMRLHWGRHLIFVDDGHDYFLMVDCDPLLQSRDMEFHQPPRVMGRSALEAEVKKQCGIHH